MGGGTSSAQSMALGVGDLDDFVVRGTGILNISGDAEAEISEGVTLGTGHVQSVGRINVTGGTMTVGGDLNVDSLRVGYTERSATVSAAGAVEIGSTAAPTDLFIGVTTTGKTVAGTLDLSGADEFTAYCCNPGLRLARTTRVGSTRGRLRNVRDCDRQRPR